MNSLSEWHVDMSLLPDRDQRGERPRTIGIGPAIQAKDGSWAVRLTAWIDAAHGSQYRVYTFRVAPGSVQPDGATSVQERVGLMAASWITITFYGEASLIPILRDHAAAKKLNCPTCPAHRHPDHPVGICECNKEPTVEEDPQAAAAAKEHAMARNQMMTLSLAQLEEIGVDPLQVLAPAGAIVEQLNTIGGPPPFRAGLLEDFLSRCVDGVPSFVALERAAAQGDPKVRPQLLFATAVRVLNAVTTFRGIVRPDTRRHVLRMVTQQFLADQASPEASSHPHITAHRAPDRVLPRGRCTACGSDRISLSGHMTYDTREFIPDVVTNTHYCADCQSEQEVEVTYE